MRKNGTPNDGFLRMNYQLLIFYLKDGEICMLLVTGRGTVLGIDWLFLRLK
jgi:hypothetical protein